MEGSYTGGSSVLGAGTTFTAGSIPPGTMGLASTQDSRQMMEHPSSSHHNNPQQMIDLQQNDEIVISAAMQQLRDPGVLIVAHGSRGKPKTVRLQLTESAITWRTETRKKTATAAQNGQAAPGAVQHIMYVDVGKQTTALRRVENASVSEQLCFSLLTKEGRWIWRPIPPSRTRRVGVLLFTRTRRSARAKLERYLPRTERRHAIVV